MRNPVIPALLLFHVVAGVGTGFFSAHAPAISSAIFLAFVFCQSSLLGMWSGLGMTHWAVRLIGLTVGSGYLAVELGLGIGDLDREVFLLAGLASFLVALVTCVVRLRKGTLRRSGASQVDNPEALQFSIRHLMALTFVVASLTGIGKLVAPSLRSLDIMAQVSVLAICYSAVALTSIWAMLGSGRPIIRSVFVVLIALVAGVVAGYVIDGGRTVPQIPKALLKK
jgi:hypothetical protein